MDWYLWQVVSWRYCRIYEVGAWELNKSCAVISNSEEWSFLPFQIHLLRHLPLPKMQGFESPLAARTGIFTSSLDEVARLKRSIFSVCALVKDANKAREQTCAELMRIAELQNSCSRCG